MKSENEDVQCSCALIFLCQFLLSIVERSDINRGKKEKEFEIRVNIQRFHFYTRIQPFNTGSHTSNDSMRPCPLSA